MIEDIPLSPLKTCKDRGSETVRFLKLDMSWGCRERYDPATLLTPYNRVLLENLIVPQPVKKFLTLYAVWRFITLHNSPPLVSVLSPVNNRTTSNATYLRTF